MKRRNILLALCAFALLLAACARQVEEPSLLNYPLVAWGSTPEEVLDALGLEATAEGEVNQLSGTLFSYQIGVEGTQFLSIPAQNMVLEFRGRTENPAEMTLAQVILRFPADGDMAAVKAAMIQQYGQSLDSYTAYQIGADGSLEVKSVAVAETEGYWRTTAAPAEVVSPEAVDSLIAQLTQREPPVNQEEARTFAGSSPLVTVTLTENAYGELSGELPEDWSRKMVTFNAVYLWELKNIG